MAGTMRALRAHALRHAGVEEGVACEGTALESRTVKVRGKAFLFLRSGDARLKLGPSLAQAKRTPGCKAGAGGWVHVTFEAGPALGTLKTWVDESYAQLAPAPKAGR
jgi:hypothetical protein